MSCCSARGYDQFFTARVAHRDARRYRKHGLDSTAERLVYFARQHGVEGATVLEVGGGVGAIELELLRAGATRATNVELSPAYEPFATRLAAEAGLADKIERRLLDFAERQAEIEPADVVVLHRVVCCYQDHEALVGAAAAHALRQLVLTFPREFWWMRTGMAAVNLWQRLRRRAFRVYLHRPASILAAARAHGLEPVARHRGLVWEFAGLVRASTS